MSDTEFYTIADGDKEFTKRIEPEVPIPVGMIMTSVMRGLRHLSGGEAGAADESRDRETRTEKV